VQFANESFNTSALVAYDVEESLEVVKRKNVGLSLEISVIVPLDYLVFNLANPTQVAVNFDNLVAFLLVPVFVIREHGFLRWLGKMRLEPLYRFEVEQALHTEEVDCNLYGVVLTDLGDRLHTGTLHDLLGELVILIESQLVCLFLLVSMDPNKSRDTRSDDVQLEIRPVFLSRLRKHLDFLVHTGPVGVEVVPRRPRQVTVGKFVGVACPQALVQVSLVF